MQVEDRMGVDELRREFRRLVDTEMALVDALQKLPEMPDYRVLNLLADAAFYGRPAADFTERGMAEQKRLGHKAVPFKAEIERAAGLWAVIRDAIRKA